MTSNIHVHLQLFLCATVTMFRQDYLHLNLTSQAVHRIELTPLQKHLATCYPEKDPEGRLSKLCSCWKDLWMLAQNTNTFHNQAKQNYLINSNISHYYINNTNIKIIISVQKYLDVITGNELFGKEYIIGISSKWMDELLLLSEIPRSNLFCI